MGQCQSPPCLHGSPQVQPQRYQAQVSTEVAGTKPLSPLDKLVEGLVTTRPPSCVLEPDDDRKEKAAMPAVMEDSDDEVLEFHEDQAIVAHKTLCRYPTKFGLDDAKSTSSKAKTVSSMPTSPMSRSSSLNMNSFMRVSGSGDGHEALKRALKKQDNLWKGESPEMNQDDICALFDTGWPEDKYDLRQYLGVGDVLNLHGRNHWGHTLLVLDTPRAIVVPKVKDAWGNDVMDNANVFVTRTLESASNLDKILVTVTLLLVHPETKIVVSVWLSDDRTHVELEPGAGALPGMKSVICPVDVVLSPLDVNTLDEEVLRLSVDETRFAMQDQAWSLRTGVRALLRNGLLDRNKFQEDDRKLELASKIEDKWRERPVCSTVPPRVWQKYLLKLSYKRFESSATKTENFGRSRTASVPASRCSNDTGVQYSTAPDPDIAWVEDVLRFMPVKDDRILPSELMNALAHVGEGWSWLDFDHGPPVHRAFPQEPPKSSHFCTVSLERPYRRKALEQRRSNSEGAPVSLGDDHFTLYCGVQFGQPSRIHGKNLISSPSILSTGFEHANGADFDWNGCCGPNYGPQCLSCRRLEDRLHQ